MSLESFKKLTVPCCGCCKLQKPNSQWLNKQTKTEYFDCIVKKHTTIVGNLSLDSGT